MTGTSSDCSRASASGTSRPMCGGSGSGRSSTSWACSSASVSGTSDMTTAYPFGAAGSTPVPFEDDVLAVLRRLLPGDVVTYGAVAEEAGHPGAARAVG